MSLPDGLLKKSHHSNSDCGGPAALATEDAVWPDLSVDLLFQHDLVCSYAQNFSGDLKVQQHPLNVSNALMCFDLLDSVSTS